MQKPIRPETRFILFNDYWQPSCGLSTSVTMRVYCKRKFGTTIELVIDKINVTEYNIIIIFGYIFFSNGQCGWRHEATTSVFRACSCLRQDLIRE